MTAHSGKVTVALHLSPQLKSTTHSGLDLSSELTPFKEAHNLIGCLNASVGVCLSSLSTHLLRRHKYALFPIWKLVELLESLRWHICQVGEVFSILEHLLQPRLINNLRSCCVDESRPLWHLGQELIVDRVFRLGRC